MTQENTVYFFISHLFHVLWPHDSRPFHISHFVSYERIAAQKADIFGEEEIGPSLIAMNKNQGFGGKRSIVYAELVCVCGLLRKRGIVNRRSFQIQLYYLTILLPYVSQSLKNIFSVSSESSAWCLKVFAVLLTELK